MAGSERAALLERLRATPRRLDEAVRDLPRKLLVWSPAPGKWSILEIVCHLRDMERDAYLGRYQRILAADEPRLPWYDADALALERRYRDERFATALRDWKRLRRETLTLLEALEPAQWDLAGVHETRGRVTIEQLVKHQIEGDDDIHLRQIETIKERAAILDKLRATARVLREGLEGRPHAELAQREVAESLALFRDFEHLMLERYAKILERERPELRPQDAVALAARLRDADIDAVAAWLAFERARTQTLELLHACGPRVWQRRAVHPHRGDISMADLVARHVDADGEILAKLRSVMPGLGRRASVTALAAPH
jgi:hypothetical protein